MSELFVSVYGDAAALDKERLTRDLSDTFGAPAEPTDDSLGPVDGVLSFIVDLAKTNLGEVARQIVGTVRRFVGHAHRDRRQRRQADGRRRGLAGPDHAARCRWRSPAAARPRPDEVPPMNVEALLLAAKLQTRLGTALQTLMQAQSSGDVERQVAANLDAAAAAEEIIEAMAPLGAEAPLDVASQADLAARHLSMAVDHLFNLGRRAAAEEAEVRASTIAERWASQSARLSLRLDQATRRRERGQFAAALATLAEVRDAARSAGLVEIAYKAAIRRAETLQWLGDPERALEELEEIRPASLGPAHTRSADPALAQMQEIEAMVAEQARDTDFHFFRFLCLRDLAASDPAMLEEAARELAHVAPAYRGMRLAATVTFYQADLLLRGGKPDEALALARPLVETFRGDQRLAHKTGAVLTIEGRALLALDRIDEAAEAANAAATALIAAGQEENVWRAHELAAETARRLGRTDAQREALAAGAEAVDRMRLAPLGWRLDNLYLQPRLGLYRDAIALAGSDGDGPTALRLIEAVKSRALTAMIGGGEPGASNVDPELLQAHDALDAAIARTQAEVIAGEFGGRRRRDDCRRCAVSGRNWPSASASPIRAGRC